MRSGRSHSATGVERCRARGFAKLGSAPQVGTGPGDAGAHDSVGRGRQQQHAGGRETSSANPNRGQVAAALYRVLSAKLRSGAGQRVLLEKIAPRNPVMPVADGLIR